MPVGVEKLANMSKDRHELNDYLENKVHVDSNTHNPNLEDSLSVPLSMLIGDSNHSAKSKEVHQ